MVYSPESWLIVNEVIENFTDSNDNVKKYNKIYEVITLVQALKFLMVKNHYLIYVRTALPIK
jgi:hypothetical protein